MTCPDCAYAASHPGSGIANARCLDCCVRVLQGLRPHGKRAQKARIEAWESMPGYVGTDLVLKTLASRAALAAMAPIKEKA